MDYQPLGRSTIKVSSVGLGTMTFGAQTSQKDAFRQLDMAFDAGITLFDCAENYPAPAAATSQGRAETILGNWLSARGRRHQVVIATKVSGPGNGPGDMSHIRGAGRCLDRTNIAAAVKASLQRLNVEAIDLYQVHWPERPVTTLRRSRFTHRPDTASLVPIETTLAALAEHLSAGKIKQIGICNESPWGAMRYLAAAELLGLPTIASIQNSYSLLDRRLELGLAEVAVRENLSLIGYSPLASGLLTGKYALAKPLPGTRSSLFPGFTSRLSTALLAASADYLQLAKDHAIEPAAMALAFARQQPFMTSVLMAASSAEQLKANLNSLNLTLPHELIKAINALHDRMPNPPFAPRTTAPD